MVSRAGPMQCGAVHVAMLILAAPEARTNHRGSRLSNGNEVGDVAASADARPTAIRIGQAVGIVDGRSCEGGQRIKQQANERLLKMTSLSNREIARQIAVGEASVRRWSEKLSASNGADKSKEAKTVTRNGKTYEIDTSNIGGKAKTDEHTPNEDAPLIAQTVIGINRLVDTQIHPWLTINPSVGGLQTCIFLLYYG